MAAMTEILATAKLKQAEAEKKRKTTRVINPAKKQKFAVLIDIVGSDRRKVEAVLSTMGFDYTEVMSPDEALLEIQARGFRNVDLVVTNFGLPKVDGLTTAAVLRCMGYDKAILMTTRSDMERVLNHKVSVDAVDAVVQMPARNDVLNRNIVRMLADNATARR